MLFAMINSLFLLSISAIHFYWATGGRVGINAAVPHDKGAPLFQPGIVATLLVALFLACAAFFI